MAPCSRYATQGLRHHRRTGSCPTDPHNPDSHVLTELMESTPGSEGRSWETDDRKVDTAPRIDPNHRSEWHVKLINGRPQFTPPAYIDPQHEPRPNALRRTLAAA
jgi:hypothetical protein